MSTENQSRTRPIHLILAWGLVTLPLAWGLWRTLLNAMKLFQ